MSMKQTSLWRSALLGSLAAIGPTAAHAQTATNNKATLQEVIVTAARRAENIQKTSIAVTAISGTTIQRQAETNLQEVIQNVPGVTLTLQQRGYTPSIRGQGTDLPPGSGQGAVATEFDGAYNIRAEGGVVGYYDLARVEVLPGPQGTLYGVNSDGGVVNVISNDPVIGKYAGNLNLTIGNYHEFRGEGMVNLPLGSVLAFRLAAAAINRTSYLTPSGGDAVAQSVRAKLLYQPSPSLSVLLGFQLDHIGGEGPNGAVPPHVNGDANNQKNPWMSATSNPALGPTSANDFESEYDKKWWANASYDLGGLATATLLPAYSRDRDEEQLCGASGPPGTVANNLPAPFGTGTCNTSAPPSPPFFTPPGWGHDPEILEQFSAEFRLSNAPGTKLLWDVGYYHWNYREVSVGAGPAVNVGQQSNAGFAEITYPITNALRLIGGVRETIDHKTSISNAVLSSADFHHFDYRAGLEYDLTPASMEYFTVATGYRPGGFNVATSGIFKTEQVTSFEAGSKNRFLDNTLQLNGDVFYYDQQNYQLLDYFTPYAPGGTVTPGNPTGNLCQLQAGEPLPTFCSPPTFNLKAHVLGAEFQARYNLTPDDQFNASGAFLDAKFDKQNHACVLPPIAPAGGCYIEGNLPAGTYNIATNPGGLVADNLANETQPHSPKVSGNFSYQHTVELASGASVTAAVQIFASSGYWVYPLENAYSYQPAYWTQSMNVGYLPASGQWSLNAYVRNLSNYAVKEAYFPAQNGEPRTFGVVGDWHF